MSGESAAGAFLAAGREADVFALGDGRVLRRYRAASEHDSADEAAVMAYVGSKGFPAPRVFSAGGTDMVMERLDGPTMAQAALAGQIEMADCGAVLADLARRLREIPARGNPAGGNPAGGNPAGGNLARGNPGQAIVHLDLHPENVIMTGRGPMVIDWRNARDGDADLDTAFTALILAQIAIGSIKHPLAGQAQIVLERFLELAPGDPLRMLDHAVELRSGQTTMSPGEVAQLPVAAARVRGEN